MGMYTDIWHVPFVCTKHSVQRHHSHQGCQY